MKERIIVLYDEIELLGNVAFALALLSRDYLVFIDIHEALNWLSLSSEFDVKRNRVVIFDYSDQVKLNKHVELVHQLIARKKTNDKIVVYLRGNSEEFNLNKNLSQQMFSGVTLSRDESIFTDLQKFSGGNLVL